MCTHLYAYLDVDSAARAQPTLTRRSPPQKGSADLVTKRPPSQSACLHTCTCPEPLHSSFLPCQTRIGWCVTPVHRCGPTTELQASPSSPDVLEWRRQRSKITRASVESSSRSHPKRADCGSGFPANQLSGVPAHKNTYPCAT